MPETPPSIASLLDLSGRTAVVTGGAVGIGLAIAARLAEARASVTIADVDGEAAAISAKELSDRGLAVQAVTTDVSDPVEVEAMFDRVVGLEGHVDILVNNAGIYPLSPVLGLSMETFSRVIAVNLRGTVLCSQQAARRMLAQQRGGRIINVTSVDALHPSVVGLAHYDASKHAAWGFTKSLALELAPHGIWVNAIAPGGIATPGTAVVPTDAPTDAPTDQDARTHFLSRIPMGRMGEPDDIGRVALFLASDLASYLTGTQIVVDGGMLLT